MSWNNNNDNHNNNNEYNTNEESTNYIRITCRNIYMNLRRIK